MPRPVTLVLLCCLLLCAQVVPAGAQVICTPVYAIEHEQPAILETRGVKMLPDGTWIVTGRVMVGNNFNGFAMRVGAAGENLWMHTWGGAGDDELSNVLLLSNGNIVLYGYAAYGSTGSRPWMLCINPNGTQQWNRVLGESTMPADSKDRLKAVMQFSDGDLIGTFNVADSTAASDPVVFKMGLDGTMRWVTRLDNGGDDSFTSIAYEGTTIYAAGYATATVKKGVITRLYSVDGTPISSRNVSYTTAAQYHQEVIGLEVYDNIISYGVQIDYQSQYRDIRVVMTQTNLQDIPFYTLIIGGTRQHGNRLRRADGGFIFFQDDAPGNYSSYIIKFDRYGNVPWQRSLNEYYVRQQHHGFDITPDGGIVAAGYFPTAWPIGASRIRLVRLDAYGGGIPCLPLWGNLLAQEATLDRTAFTWAAQPPAAAWTGPLLFLNQPFLTTESPVCAAATCIDRTPLPPDCKKTYRIDYGGLQTGIFRDAVTTPDGGRIAVGGGYNQGVAVRVGANGDVIWSKSLGEFAKVLMIMRILAMPDGTYTVFANRGYTINHGAYNDIEVFRIDIDGNIRSSHVVQLHNRGASQDIGDVALAPDGGFVIVMNDSYGIGYIYNMAVRFDPDYNVLWTKEIKHSVATPVYRSATCTGNAVYLAADEYSSYHYNKFSVDKLDLATGNQLWSKEYKTADGQRTLINKVVAVNDSAYVFLNQYAPTGTFTGVQSVVMVRLDPQGKPDKALDINSGQFLLPNTTDYKDATPPSVVYTADQDFVLAMPVRTPVSRQLNIIRFSKEGAIHWSVNHPGIDNSEVFNIRQQGRSFVIMGRAADPQPLLTGFYNSFILKVDSAGQIVQPNTGSCATTPAATLVTPTAVSETTSRIDDIVSLTNTPMQPATLLSRPIFMDASLYCFEPANCRQVTLEKLGNGCTVTDTLVYYLKDAANCGAVSHWTYDASQFKATAFNSDTLRLVPLKTGSSLVRAVMEGYCFTETKNINASVLISAGNMKLAPDTELCEGASLRISAGPGYASYQWNTLATDSFLVVNTPGKYYVDVTDNCGGSGTDTIVVTRAGDGFSAAAPQPTKCNDDMIGLSATSGFLNYRWTTAQGHAGDGAQVSVNPAVTTKYYVDAEKYPGCRVRDSVEITVLRSPAINLVAQATICPGDSLLVDAGSGFTQYLWNTGGTQQQATLKTPGRYTVAAAWTNGCPSYDTLDLQWHARPQPVLDKNNILCTNATRVLTPGQFSTYLWNDGSAGATMTVAGTGQYWVAVTDQHGCKAADTTVISTIAPLPADFLPISMEICQYGDLKIIPAVSYKDYKWSDQSTGATLTITKPGRYWLQATDRNNCTGADTVTVTSKECLLGLYIPNAFTPNSDRVNDVLTPMLFGNADYLHFTVYNRWGQLVFETRTMKAGWDGKIKGIAAVAGTYVWQCRYKLQGLPEKTEKGIVQLIR